MRDWLLLGPLLAAGIWYSQATMTWMQRMAVGIGLVGAWMALWYLVLA